MRKIRDWFFTIPTIAGIALTLLVFEALGRLTLPMGIEHFEHTMTNMQRVLLKVFGIAGTRIRAEGTEGLDPSRGYILVSNHQSMLDVPIFGGLLPGNMPKFIAKRELARWIPAVSLYLNRGGNAVIDRQNRHEALEVIADVGRESERRGVSVVIFPEGTRSRTGDLGAFRTAGAAALLAAAPSLPIVPTAIDGSWKVLKNNYLPIPFGTEVRVRFGEPILRDGTQSVRESIKECRRWIDSTLEEWRGESTNA